MVGTTSRVRPDIPLTYWYILNIIYYILYKYKISLLRLHHSKLKKIVMSFILIEMYFFLNFRWLSRISALSIFHTIHVNYPLRIDGRIKVNTKSWYDLIVRKRIKAIFYSDIANYCRRRVIKIVMQRVTNYTFEIIKYSSTNLFQF